MTKITAEEAATLRRTPITDFIPKRKNTLVGSSAISTALVASLRQRGLISVTLDWDRSEQGLVCRHIDLTDAGLAALREHRG